MNKKLKTLIGWLLLFTVYIGFVFVSNTFEQAEGKSRAKLVKKDLTHAEFYPCNLDKIQPNPFDGETTISYVLDRAAQISLDITTLNGDKITTLVDEKQSPGKYFIHWDGKSEKGSIVNSGIYLCRLNYDNRYIDVQKLVYVR